MKAEDISPDLLSLMLNAAHSDELERRRKQGEAAAEKRACVKCGTPVPKTNFPRHMRNCDG